MSYLEEEIQSGTLEQLCKKKMMGLVYFFKDSELYKFGSQVTSQIFIKCKGESDPGFSQTLSNQYNFRYKDVLEKMDYLDIYRRGELVVENAPHNPGNGVQVKKGDGNKDKDDENSKLKGQLSDAIVTEKPKVKWTDIAGLVQAKKILIDALIISKQHAKLYKGVRQPWNAILLYGPPGTGKTHLAKACANEVEATFFQISSANLLSKYVGESERLVKELFSMAREKKPSIIFVDEIDYMCGARGEGQSEGPRRMIAEFLIQLTQAQDETDIFVLGATSTPWDLNEAIRRRFQKKIYIPLPDVAARAYILKNELQQNKNDLNEQQFQDIASKTEGFCSSDMSILIKDAAHQQISIIFSATQFKEINVEGQNLLTPTFGSVVGSKVVQTNCLQIDTDQIYIPPITHSDFLSSLKKVKSSISQEQLKKFEDWTLKFGEEGV